MFTKSAAFYDAIYGFKDYAAEAENLHEIIQEHKQSPGNRLLDVACGTGLHLAHLRNWYDAQGLDLDPELLKIARERCPDITFHEADMVDFNLGEQFDVVTCLFSSIGYVRTVDRLQQALQTISRHTRAGGVVIIEPWIMPDQWLDRHIAALYIDEPELKVARMNTSQREDEVSIIDFHYLVGTPDGVEHFTERHEIGLFTHEQYVEAFDRADLEVTFDPDGTPLGRGVYIGIKQ